MAHAKLGQMLGISGRSPKRPRSTSASPAPAVSSASQPKASLSDVPSADLDRCAGWLFLFYDSYAARTGTGQRLVIRFVPPQSLPFEAAAWRATHAVDGRILVGRDLPSAITSRLGALVDLAEPYSPPCAVSCIVDATGRDACAALQAAEFGNVAGGLRDDSEQGEGEEEEEEGDDEENPDWD